MRDLVVGAQNGDREAFAALVHMTSDRMYALAARILRDIDARPPGSPLGATSRDWIAALYRCASDGRRSPASIRVSRRFSAGVSGQENWSS